MNESNHTNSQAQVLLGTEDLRVEMEFFTKHGFRLEQIFPADDPSVAILSGHGIYLRIDKKTKITPIKLYLLTDHPEDYGGDKNILIAPNGSQIEIQRKTNPLNVPATQHKFEIRKLQDNDPWIIGRAGMLYRDLIPDRLGGSIIASHIRIPKGGPVPDMVHYHTIGFQLIFCYRGWVKLVYEDQGPPFILNAGDCVTQPPEIRHRVLESSDNLEVIEIGVPADHITTIDHELKLPTGQHRPEREFQGQRFCHHQLKNAEWKNWELSGFECRDTGISEATKGEASVQVIRTIQQKASEQILNHQTDILFTFVMEGQLHLKANHEELKVLNRGDAFVIPPNLDYVFADASDDLELLEVRIN